MGNLNVAERLHSSGNSTCGYSDVTGVAVTVLTFKVADLCQCRPPVESTSSQRSSAVGAYRHHLAQSVMTFSHERTRAAHVPPIDPPPSRRMTEGVEAPRTLLLSSSGSTGGPTFTRVTRTNPSHPTSSWPAPEPANQSDSSNGTNEPGNLSVPLDPQRSRRMTAWSFCTNERKARPSTGSAQTNPSAIAGCTNQPEPHPPVSPRLDRGTHCPTPAHRTNEPANEDRERPLLDGRVEPGHDDWDNRIDTNEPNASSTRTNPSRPTSSWPVPEPAIQLNVGDSTNEPKTRLHRVFTRTNPSTGTRSWMAGSSPAMTPRVIASTRTNPSAVRLCTNEPEPFAA